MPAKDTIVIFIHGANQSEKNEAKNLQTWKEAFAVDNNARKVENLVSGNENHILKNGSYWIPG